MHIKAVNVQGFKSYREQTNIEEFSPRHNVVVGRNGSGKSNFFSAIQFVLADEYSNLRMEQRQSLLHEGTGPRLMSAKVEIVFDNSDGRLPIDRDEVHLVRQIGAKKDQYFLEGKSVTRTEVVNLMESAGFSRSNPYYIVKQGKINELATAPDVYRLRLLREVAGTRVYDERKEESKTNMRETENKREKIESLLKYIEDRLKTLEEEKEELKEYQKWDRMKRSLEYTLYEQEQRDNRRKEDKLMHQKEELLNRSNELTNQFNTVDEELNRIKRKRRDLERRFAGLKTERDQLNDDQTKYFQQKTQYELRVRDLRQEVEKERRQRQSADGELEQLRATIAEHTERLEQLRPRHTELQRQHADAHTRIRILDQRIKELYGKQGLTERFNSAQERDNYLRTELRNIERQIGAHRDQIVDLKQDIQNDVDQQETIRENLARSSQNVEEQRHKLEEHKGRKMDLTRQRDSLAERRKDLWRQESGLNGTLSSINDEIRSSEGHLRGSAGRAMSQGKDSVTRVLRAFGESESQSAQAAADGYRGMVIENVSSEAAYHRAIDVVAGNKLFNHIVDTDRTATQLLHEMNSQRLAGQVDFFPINRLHSHEQHYPNTPDARPLLHCVQFDERLTPVMRNLFGRTLVVRNMEVGVKYARDYHLDCVTLDGDMVAARGTLTGGYIDNSRRRPRLELQANLSELNERKAALHGEQQQLRQQLNAIEGDMAKLVQDIEKVENEAAKDKEAYSNITLEKSRAAENLRRLEHRQRQKGEQLLKFQGEINEWEAHKESVRAQLGTALASQLTDDEQKEIERSRGELKELRRSYDQLNKQKTDVEKHKSKLENLLENNLLPKRERLSTKLADISMDERRQDLDQFQTELNDLNAKITENSKKLAQIEDDMVEYNEEKDKLNKEQDDIEERHRDVTNQLQECAKHSDAITSKLTGVHKKKEELRKRFQEIGTLPADAFDKYHDLSHKQLEKKLMQCNAELKKYENVNKKALDQFVQFSEQKETLVKRQDELERAHRSIVDLMQVLEHRKSEAIQLTFKQVSAYFKEVFERLVPTGQGQLVMKKDMSRAAADPNESTESTDESSSGRAAAAAAAAQRDSTEQFTGVGIRVSFVGSEETREMNQLSGGQKSLVALALIFSIQKVDPAPFYLFDEIDAALDAQHRKAVADMIHELCGSAQFITTTFRPELLEHADKFYGVRFKQKVSHVDVVTREEAYDFVEYDSVQA